MTRAGVCSNTHGGPKHSHRPPLREAQGGLTLIVSSRPPDFNSLLCSLLPSWPASSEARAHGIPSSLQSSKLFWFPSHPGPLSPCSETFVDCPWSPDSSAQHTKAFTLRNEGPKAFLPWLPADPSPGTSDSLLLLPRARSFPTHHTPAHPETL